MDESGPATPYVTARLAGRSGKKPWHRASGIGQRTSEIGQRALGIELADAH
jgi:hypothetical protein